MKKTFKFYALIWAILVVAFNLVVFLVRPVFPWTGIKYDERFWIAWGFVFAAMVGNLICAVFTLTPKNLTKTFYRLPLIKITWVTMIVMIAASTVVMLIPNCPAWVAAIACIVVCLVHAGALIKVLLPVGTVSKIDAEVKAKTAFVKMLTAEAEGTLARAHDDDMKDLCKKVAEAARYSDPMSSPELVPLEDQITSQFYAFNEAVCDGDLELAEAISEELLALLVDRNKKCMLLK